MPIRITEDIRSITDLKRNTNAVLAQIHQTKRPVILTVNGKAEAVIVDAKEYEKKLRRIRRNTKENERKPRNCDHEVHEGERKKTTKNTLS